MSDPWIVWGFLWCGSMVILGIAVIAWPRTANRKWVRRLRDLERARIDWQARVIQDQAFWRDGK